MKKTLLALALAGLTFAGSIATSNAFSLQNGDTSFSLTGKLKNVLATEDKAVFLNKTQFGLKDTLSLDYKLKLKGALNEGYSYEFSTDTSSLFYTSRYVNKKGTEFYGVKDFEVVKPRLILSNANNTFQAGKVKNNYDAFGVEDYTVDGLNGDKVATTRGLYYGYSDDLTSYSASYSFTPTGDEQNRLLSLNYLYNYSSVLSYETNLVVGNKTSKDLFQGKLLNNTISLDFATKSTAVNNLEAVADFGLLYANTRASELVEGNPTDKYLRPALATQFTYTTTYVKPRLNLATNVKLAKQLNLKTNKAENVNTYENILGVSLLANEDNVVYFLNNDDDKTQVKLFYTNDYTPEVANVTPSVLKNKVDFNVTVSGKDTIPYVIPTYTFDYNFENSKTAKAAYNTDTNKVSTSLNLESNVAEVNAYVTPSVKDEVSYDFASKTLSNDFTVKLKTPDVTVFKYLGDNTVTFNAELSYTLSTSKVDKAKKADNTNSGLFTLAFKY